MFQDGLSRVCSNTVLSTYFRVFLILAIFWKAMNRVICFKYPFLFCSCACKLLIRIWVSSTRIPPFYSHKFVVCSLNSLFLKNSHLLPINLYYPMHRYHCASKARTSNAVITFYKSYICNRVVLLRFGPL